MTTHRLALRARPVRAAGARRPGQRASDLVLASVCVLLLAPVLVLAWVLIRCTSPGGAVFRQTRLGRDGQPFAMYKFRTMAVGCDDGIHRQYVAGELQGIHQRGPDPRVTRVGRVLRRLSVDELPQLFNVLEGSMSLVGPRPMLAWELDLVGPAYQRRFAVQPGITGLWQVSGRDRLTLLERLDLDLAYVDRCGFRLDLAILARTVLVVLTTGGAS